LFNIDYVFERELLSSELVPSSMLGKLTCKEWTRSGSISETRS